ncbi:hypothetical protein YPPY100_4222, partial [Yersinia pestis PY-100]
MVVQE